MRKYIFWYWRSLNYASQLLLFIWHFEYLQRFVFENRKARKSNFYFHEIECFFRLYKKTLSLFCKSIVWSESLENRLKVLDFLIKAKKYFIKVEIFFVETFTILVKFCCLCAESWRLLTDIFDVATFKSEISESLRLSKVFIYSSLIYLSRFLAKYISFLYCVEK